MSLESISNLINAMEAGEITALATVVGPDNLPPRLLGAKLLVRSDGERHGGTGFAALDGRIADTAEEFLKGPSPSRLADLPLEPDERRYLGLDEDTVIKVFVDVIKPPMTLLIAGAGHVAQPIARIGKMLGFEIAVMDDRPEWANSCRFPEASQVMVGDYTEELSRFPVTPETYVVIVTRGHVQDEDSLRAVIGRGAAYIGMIGSARKIRGIYQRLREAGISQDLIDKVHAPIGIDIGAETPEEIAVSIMAEIVNVRRRAGRHAASLTSGAK